MFDFRKLFGFKRKFAKEQTSLNAAVRAFLAHARAEASRLQEALIPLIEERCLSQAIELRSILERPLKYDDKTDGEPSEKKIIDAHLYAYALASGMDRFRAIPELDDHANVMEHVFYRLLVAEDVGPGNVGTTPSPWLRSGTHVQWAAGTFTGGKQSEQKALVTRYRWVIGEAKRLDPTASKQPVGKCLVVLLVGIGLLRPSSGIRRRVYSTTSLTGDLVALNEVVPRKADAPLGPIERWSDDLVIDDVSAALKTIPLDWSERARGILAGVDPLWPAFSSGHRITS